MPVPLMGRHQRMLGKEVSLEGRIHSVGRCDNVWRVLKEMDIRSDISPLHLRHARYRWELRQGLPGHGDRGTHVQAPHRGV